MREHLYNLFERESHSGFHEDVSVIVIDKDDGSITT